MTPCYFSPSQRLPRQHLASPFQDTRNHSPYFALRNKKPGRRIKWFFRPIFLFLSLGLPPAIDHPNNAIPGFDVRLAHRDVVDYYPAALRLNSHVLTVCSLR